MKRVLFVCVENAGRSQMAEGFARHLGAGAVEAASAGSRPLGRLHPVVIQAMREKGIDITHHHSKGLDDVDQASFDVAVTMCEDECPYVDGQTVLHWEMQNPAGHGIEDVRPIRDAIEQRVRDLLHKLGQTA